VKAKSPPSFHKVVETFMAGNDKGLLRFQLGGKQTSPEKRKIPQGQAWSPSMGRRSVICSNVVGVVMEIIGKKENLRRKKLVLRKFLEIRKYFLDRVEIHIHFIRLI
jgi:hypothetical protein